MKHKTKITRLCYFLIQGHGINEALAELGLTPTYLERLRRSDRIKLHQARNIFVEGLQRELVNRSRLGRATGQLERVLDNLPPLDLPGDDKDEEREHRQWRRRNFASDDDGAIVDVDYFASLSDFPSVADDEDGDAIDPASEAPVAPRRRPQANSARLALQSPQSVEEPNQRASEAVAEGVETAPVAPSAPDPEPKLVWVRLFTGRAIGRAADGKIIESLLPGADGYPHESFFVNWS